MEVVLTRSLEALLLPPAGPLFLALLGLVLHWRGKRAARWLTLGGLMLLYLCALPPLAEALLHGLERHPALTPAQARDSAAQVIVVLGAGRYSGAPEYGGDTLSPPGLERVRYAAHLHRLTGLPLLVSAGAPLGEPVSEAALMAQVLRDDYGVSDIVQENASRTTGENALFTARQLQAAGQDHVLLVTHAWHMSRAAAAFENAGLTVTAAPTAYTTRNAARPLLLMLLPDARALHDTRLALHEYLGRVWYWVRY